LSQKIPSPKAANEFLQAWKERKLAINAGVAGADIIVDRCGVENVTTMVEKLYSIVKTHRNMIDLELKVCRDEVHDRIE